MSNKNTKKKHLQLSVAEMFAGAVKKKCVEHVNSISNIINDNGNDAGDGKGIMSNERNLYLI